MYDDKSIGTGNNQLRSIQMAQHTTRRRAAITTKERHVDPTLEKISHVMDQYFRIPGTNIRFGLDPIIGFLLPVAGDSINALLSVYLVLKSIGYGLPKVIIGRMIFNIGLDYVIGSVPLIGDLIDFGFKANQKNMDLLNRFALGERKANWSDWLWVLILLGLLGVVIFGWVLAVLWLYRSISLLDPFPGLFIP